MDGDEADLVRLAELKNRYGCILVVDEAHSVGVCGPRGAGLCAELGISDEVDILIGTLGKAFGSTGAYGVFRKELRDYLVNAMRPFIFTTGLPPVVLSWTLFVLEHIADMDEQRRRVRENGIALRK